MRLMSLSSTTRIDNGIVSKLDDKASSWSSSPCLASVRVTGSTISKLVPTCISERKSISPSIFSTNCFTIDSPNPVPLPLTADCFSPCIKGVNNEALVTPSIPSPVSSMEISKLGKLNASLSAKCIEM